MTDISIVDTHLHIWDTGRLSYPWLVDVPSLNRPHLPEEYRRATKGLNVGKAVFVQCEADLSQYKDEADWVAEVAAREPFISGIVAWAPLELGAAAAREVEDLAKRPLVKGIRRIIQFESDPGFCLRPDFVRGVQLLSEFDLHFEICIKGDEQFRNTLALVRKCPEVRFMLDHIGKPFIKETRIEPWAGHLRELASLPNTWCKMSGLVNEADWETWSAQDVQPYIERVMDCFGFDRVVFGGDWPVCTLASAYAKWFSTLWDALGGASVEERDKLFRSNAVTFYRL